MATSKQLQPFSTIAEENSKPVFAPKLSLNETLHAAEHFDGACWSGRPVSLSPPSGSFARDWGATPESVPLAKELMDGNRFYVAKVLNSVDSFNATF